MAYSGRERRKRDSEGPRLSFGELAAEAMRTRIRETRVDDAHWAHTVNLAWVRWRIEDGRYAFCGLRRSFDFLTGEMGVSPVEVDLNDLPLIEKHDQAMPAGCRIRLGHVLQGHDRWWSSGGTEDTLRWRLGWLSQQMRFRLKSFLDASAPAA